MADQIKFGTDGWRGIVADDFTFANVRRVAQGAAEYIRSLSSDPLAVVGYDCRFASEDFARTVADVFAANGVRTLMFDRPSPTQVASWTVIDRKATGAAVVTASHNPYLFNGIKFKSETGSAASGDVIAQLEPRINALEEVAVPDRSPPNINAAIAAMRSGGQDLCICTDGDADRVGIIDETGRFINQLQVFALLMLYLFEIRHMVGPVVKMVDKLGAEFGVPVYEVPVGFKNVAPKMIETEAVLGGEESGGFAIKGHIPERDGILIGLLFADMIVKYGQPVSQILAALERRVGPHAYARHDIHLDRETYDQDRKRILHTLETHEPSQVAGVKVERIRSDDGFKFYLADGSWVLLRASGTEALVRIYSEAADKAAVEARLAALEDIVGLRAHV